MSGHGGYVRHDVHDYDRGRGDEYDYDRDRGREYDRDRGGDEEHDHDHAHADHGCVLMTIY